MFQFSQNYRLRLCHFERDQVPTQTVIKNKMGPALAEVYFKSMNSKLKVVAGLEPPMKGGGADWIIPPQELLQNKRVVMKPFRKKYISQWNCYGMDEYGMKVVEIHRQRMKDERTQTMHDTDVIWKKKVDTLCRLHWDDCSALAATANTNFLRAAFREFAILYTSSVTKFQDLLFDSAALQIKNARQEAFQQMQTRYKIFLHQQATMLYDRYTMKLDKEKERLKNSFSRRLLRHRGKLTRKLHDINVEKHVIVEKSRKYLECQNLACQVYVALKEREECAKEMELSKYRHTGTMMTLTEKLKLENYEIKLAEEKEKKRDEFVKIWQQKVCHVVKKFQMFVSYCLNLLPEHADFFINMEKLMLLQVNEVLEDPYAESIYVPNVEPFTTPVPETQPFYLFCDQRYETKVNPNLCPKHCTSSASQLPAIVINKRCIYAACDNFEQFADKILGYLGGKRGEDADFEDHHEYSYDVPVTYTLSQQLKELKLESSLFQLLQQEISNLKDLSLQCCGCNVTHCFNCDKFVPKPKARVDPKMEPNNKQPSISQPEKVITRIGELKHEREPKWESYSKFIESNKCSCAKTAKKQLLEHLPPYMRNTSYYDAPELLDYETCPVTSLKTLVDNAKKKTPKVPTPPKIPSKTRQIATQYSDTDFDYLCTCLSDEDLNQFMKKLITGNRMKDVPDTENYFRVVGGSWSHTFLTKESGSFAIDRATSLRNLVDESPEIKEIFRKKDCYFK